MPGVELLRTVCYSLKSVDGWCASVQAAYNARSDGSGVETDAQVALLREVYEALDAPYDERFRSMHACLHGCRKRDDDCSQPYGVRPQ